MSYLVEELPISLLPPVRTDKEDSSTVDREQSPNGVEFGGEDLQNDECEGELGERSADLWMSAKLSCR